MNELFLRLLQNNLDQTMYHEKKFNPRTFLVLHSSNRWYVLVIQWNTPQYQIKVFGNQHPFYTEHIERKKYGNVSSGLITLLWTRLTKILPTDARQLNGYLNFNSYSVPLVKTHLHLETNFPFKSHRCMQFSRFAYIALQRFENREIRTMRLLVPI